MKKTLILVLSALSLPAQPIPQVVVSVATTNSTAVAQQNASYVCTGINDVATISNAMNSIPCGGLVILSSGSYNIDYWLAVPPNTSLIGSGFNTLLFVNPTNSGTLAMSNNASIQNIKIQGSIGTAGLASIYGITAGNNALIKNVWIDSLWSGIDTSWKTNVHLQDYIATNLRATNGWANAVEGVLSDGVLVDGVDIENCDRALEFEDGARNIFCQNGRLIHVHPLTATVCFSISAHTHNTSLQSTENISYSHFYLEDSGGPVVDSMSLATLPTKNILFNDISIVNPWTNSYTEFFAEGNGITFNHVKAYGIVPSRSYTVTVTGKNTTLNDVSFEDGPVVFSVSGSTNLIIRNCSFNVGSRTGVTMARITGSTAQNVLMDSCVWYNCPSSIALQVSSGVATRISRCNFYRTAATIAIQDLGLSTVIQDNYFQGAWTYEAIDLAPGTGTVVKGNMFVGSTGSHGFINIEPGSTDVRLDGNVVK